LPSHVLSGEEVTQLPKATGAQQVAWKGVSRYMAMIKMMESQLHPIQRSSWTSDWLE